MNKASLSNNVKIRLGTNFLRRASNDSLIPFMTIYLVKIIGASYAGFIISLILISGIASSLYGGHLSDKLGRKFVLLSTEFFHMGSVLGMLFAYCFNQIFLFISFYFLKNIFLTLGTSSGEALLIDSSETDNERKIIYQWQYWLCQVAIPLGISLGAFFYDKNFIYTFILSISCSLFVFISYFNIENIQSGSHSNTSSESVSSYFEIFYNSAYIKFILSCLFIACLDFQLFNFIGVRLSSEFHATLTWVNNLQITGIDMLGILKTIAIITTVLLTFPLIHFVKIDDRQKILFGYILYVASLMALGVSNNFYILIISIIIMNIGEILFYSPRQTLMARLIPVSSRGKYLSIFHLHARLGNILASFILMSSSLIGKYGVTLIYFLMGCASFYFVLVAGSPARRSLPIKKSPPIAFLGRDANLCDPRNLDHPK